MVSIMRRASGLTLRNNAAPRLLTLRVGEIIEHFAIVPRGHRSQGYRNMLVFTRLILLCLEQQRIFLRLAFSLDDLDGVLGEFVLLKDFDPLADLNVLLCKVSRDGLT